MLITSAILTDIQSQDTVTSKLLIDNQWFFYKGGCIGAEKVDFDDSQWRIVNLPHDWSIEDLPGTQSPFSREAISQGSGGFTSGGTGWYRKVLEIPKSQKGKIIHLQFDGIYMNAEIWLNGTSLGKHPNGYTTYWYDITKLINYENKNVISVKVSNEGENSRWYSGSGIYRHVWLNFYNPIHIDKWGVSVTTQELTTDKADLNCKTTILNETDGIQIITLITRLFSKDDQIVSTIQTQQSIPARGKASINQILSVDSPTPWSVNNPYLYKLVSDVVTNGTQSDRFENFIGIRTIKFSAEKGFLLNGEEIKLKGGCIHHDNGILGARAFDRAEERKIEILKRSGFNAIRTAHNPSSEALLDACDKLGILVIEEAFDMWTDAKNLHDYHLYFSTNWSSDLEKMILRDRNHPSIILWSIGNEIPNLENENTLKTARNLADYCRLLDPSRPITAAVHQVNEKKDGIFDILDVAGYNYASDKYNEDLNRKPDRIIIATESNPLHAFRFWQGVEEHNAVIGDFVWTAIDYIGEASIGWRGFQYDENLFPWNLAYCGDIDICGWKRPQSYYRDALWATDKVISVFVKPPTPTFAHNLKKESWSNWHWHDVVADWNWENHVGLPFEVSVYSNCDKIELFLNNKSLGVNDNGKENEFLTEWKVPYQPGELKAVGYSDNHEICHAKISTSLKANQLRLKADRININANGQDLCFIEVEIIDEKGIINPKAQDLITFEIDGPGEIIATGNGNPTSLESYTLPQRKAWQGKCMVVVRTTETPGKIILKARSENLKPCDVSINSIK